MGLRDKARRLRSTLTKTEDEKPLISTEDLESVEEGKFDEVIEGTSIREKKAEQEAQSISEETSKSKEISEDIDLNTENRIISLLNLYEVIKGIIESNNVDSLIDVALFSIMGQIGVKSISIFTIQPNEKDYKLIVSNGIPAEKLEDIEWSKENDLLKLLKEKKESIDIRNIEKKGVLEIIIDKLTKMEIAIATPLIAADELIGFILLGEKIENDFTKTDIEFINLFFQAFAPRLKEIQQTKDLVWKNNIYEIIYNFLQEGSLISSIEEIVSVFVYMMEDIFGVKDYYLFLYDEFDKQYKYLGELGKEGIRGAKGIAYRNSLILKYIEYNEPVFIEEEDIEEFFELLDNFHKIDEREFLCFVPLISAKKKIGFFIIGKSENYTKDEYENVFTLYKDALSVIISSILGVGKPAQEKTTNLYSIIEKQIASELSKAEELSINLSISKLTIKNLDRVYNLMGYSTTEDIVQTVIDIFYKFFPEKENNKIYRIYTNEFILILPGKNKKEVKKRIEDFIEELETKKSRIDKIKLHYRYIVSSYPEDSDDVFFLLDFVK